MYLFKNIQALQLLHDKQHEERDKGNQNIKLDYDTSCSRCYSIRKIPGTQFDNFCEIWADASHAQSFSGLTIKIFEEIVTINHEKERKQFEDKFEQLVWAFRYERDFEKQNGELKNLFIHSMLMSEKFKYGNEETKRRIREHYELELRKLAEKEKGESSEIKEEQFTGVNSELSTHGSIIGEETTKIVTLTIIDEKTAKLLIGGEEIKVTNENAIKIIKKHTDMK